MPGKPMAIEIYTPKRKAEFFLTHHEVPIDSAEKKKNRTFWNQKVLGSG